MLDGTAAAYALLLGVVAAFNPCGFALLPAYITVLVTGSAEEGVTRPMAVRRALLFGLAMTLGFMAVFTAFGLLFGGVNAGLQGSILPYLSYVTAAMGVILIWLGIVLAKGGELKGPGLRLNSNAPGKSFWSQTAYGASFAVASLSCTIGLFLAIVTQALAATNPLGAVAPFIIYGLGMGTSILIVSLIAALAGSGVASALRSKTPAIMRAGGVLMILAGIYVLLFGLSEILPKFGIHTLDPVLTTTAKWQGSVTSAIQSWGTPVLIGLVVVTTLVVLWVFVAGKTKKGANAAAAPASMSPEAGGGDSVALHGTTEPTPSAKKSGPRIADASTLDAIRGSIKK
ncbi:cytochrome c biogenesis CcdA family protein [Demequina aurantiaca]|uniref:cytochrome c biogenesis CcdA family protein n=1 Tax=Demequina aurantiaca TaxID=676200 RepID=UPI00078484F1|nr:cytochrome c biogenesis CcdA family protein [Demequina aurantiaca]